MRPTLSINIDEAGDPGVKDGLHHLANRHEWLCMSAVAVRSSRDYELVEWVREMRTAANSTQSSALHYAKITTARRASVARVLASKPCRALVLASHKSNLREYVNPRIGAMMTAGTFYNWCIRLLLERVTAWAEEWQKRELGHVEPIEIIFEERGGHDYEHFFSYVDRLRMQIETQTLLLRGPGLNPVHLDREHWIVRRKELWAGLQLADSVASAFYQAANTASPSYDLEPAKALERILVADGKGSVANRGLTLWPLPHQAPVPPPARAIFEHYGYSF